jgi:hypothetical protein
MTSAGSSSNSGRSTPAPSAGGLKAPGQAPLHPDQPAARRALLVRAPLALLVLLGPLAPLVLLVPLGLPGHLVLPVWMVVLALLVLPALADLQDRLDRVLAEIRDTILTARRAVPATPVKATNPGPIRGMAEPSRNEK